MIKIIVTIHLFIIIANLIALVYLLADLLSFSQNVAWYISIPLITLISSLIFNRNTQCALTHLENKLRKKQGLTPIKGFVRHYIINFFKQNKK